MADEPKALIYTTSKGSRLELRYESETMWLSQKQISELFGVGVSAVNKHLTNIYDEAELERESTISKMEIVAIEGSRLVERSVEHYNLDVIISVGYRVSSKQGTIFRKWATSALVQLATKGFVVDSEKLKGNADRLRELRDIIRDIRSDEANIYAELRRICAMCQDYDPSSRASRDFFAEFQNRMLYAVTSHTAASIIKSRANSNAENMGLTAWKGDHVIKSDTDVAKNYLGKIELKDLNRLVGMVLDYFEDQAERGFLVAMANAETKLVEILTVNKRLMLKGFGTVKATGAKKHAHAQYQMFNEQRRMKEITALNEAAKSLPAPRGKKKSA
jgi:hypothetical protein